MEYTPEQQAAAWAAYYAQQGWDPATLNQYYGTAGTTATAPVASSSNAPFYPPRLGYDPEAAVQSSAYTPGGVVGTPDGEKAKEKQKAHAQGKRETVIRKAGGKVWEDQTLVEWDPSWFRLFVGDLSNDVQENTLNNAFSKYPSYCKCKVVRDRLSMKAKYGFIAFKDPEDMLKAWKEMDGKYVGNRPIRLMKVSAQYGGVAPVTVGARKAKELDKIAKNKGKPLNGRPTPW